MFVQCCNLRSWRVVFIFLIVVSLTIYTFHPWRRPQPCQNEEVDSHPSIRSEHGVFQDELFAPLLSLYKSKAKEDLHPNLTKFRSGKIPRVLLWVNPPSDKFWESQTTHLTKGLCPLPCQITYDVSKRHTADAIMIYLRGAADKKSVIKSLSPRDPGQPWIMQTFEAPPLANSFFKTNYSEFNGLFNRTMMYRYDADIRLPHGFVVRRGEDANSLPPRWVIPPLQDQGTHTRKLAVAFISNCKSRSNRLNYIKRFQEHAPIDIYGKCGSLKCGHRMYVDYNYDPTSDPCLRMAGEKYLFFFAFENAFCRDYVTEKVYNLLHYPIVPVVRGSANYSTILPPHSYIDANKYTPQELAEKLLYLQAHPEEYQKYLDWRCDYQASTVGGERTFCHLCARLYDPELYQYKVIEDFEDWFVKKSQCLELLDV